MNHCFECGTRLTEKLCGDEGLVPFCPSCDAFRFPVFNTAISTVLLNPSRDKVLLIQQYGRPFYILVAGYVTRGESLDQTLIREVKEETGLNVLSYEFNHSEFFEPSNTLMCNFIAQVDSEDLSRTNHEVDLASWFSFADALEQVKPESLAQRFLQAGLGKLSRIPAGA